MKTLVLCNQKGGVGKSAVATLLAHHLTHRGQRVLAIDLDHQGNFTKPLRMFRIGEGLDWEDPLDVDPHWARADIKAYGPHWPGNLGGPPAAQKLWKPLRSVRDASRLWSVSEELKGAAFR